MYSPRSPRSGNHNGIAGQHLYRIHRFVKVPCIWKTVEEFLEAVLDVLPTDSYPGRGNKQAIGREQARDCGGIVVIPSLREFVVCSLDCLRIYLGSVSVLGYRRRCASNDQSRQDKQMHRYREHSFLHFRRINHLLQALFRLWLILQHSLYIVEDSVESSQGVRQEGNFRIAHKSTNLNNLECAKFSASRRAKVR
jgi:hypothetical protein